MSGRGSHRRSRRPGPPGRVYYTVPSGGAPVESHVESRPSDEHADRAPGNRLGTSVDLDRMNWEAQVDDAIRSQEAGLAIGRLITSENTLADIGKLARRLRSRSLGGMALVPFGIRYTAAMVPLGTDISQLELGAVYEREPRFDEEFEINLSRPDQRQSRGTTWVGARISHGDEGVVEYLAAESETARRSVAGIGSHNLRVPSRFVAIFGFQDGDTGPISYATNGLMEIDRQASLGPLTTMPDVMINLGQESP